MNITRSLKARVGGAVTLLSAISALSNSITAEALSFLPTRLILDDNHRAVQLQLINDSDRAQRYVIEWQSMQMDRSGNVAFVEQSQMTTPPSSDHIISGPRQAIVPPGGRQVVRFLSKIPPDAPDGEYRSHILITEPPALGSEISPEANGDITINIDTVIRTTLPVILRKGNLQADLDPLEWWLETSKKTEPELGLLLQRSGNRSVNVLATIEWLPFEGKPEILVEEQFAFYTDIEQKIIRHQLPDLETEQLSAGRIRYNLEQLDREGAPVKTVFEETLSTSELAPEPPTDL